MSVKTTRTQLKSCAIHLDQQPPVQKKFHHKPNLVLPSSCWGPLFWIGAKCHVRRSGKRRSYWRIEEWWRRGDRGLVEINRSVVRHIKWFNKWGEAACDLGKRKTAIVQPQAATSRNKRQILMVYTKQLNLQRITQFKNKSCEIKQTLNQPNQKYKRNPNFISNPPSSIIPTLDNREEKYDPLKFQPETCRYLAYIMHLPILGRAVVS